MTIYRKKEDGTYETTTATQEEFDTLYSKAGWTDVEPIDILGAVGEESSKSANFIAEDELDALSPIGYAAQMPYENGFIPISEYLTLLFPETKDNFYYPGAEDNILDGNVGVANRDTVVEVTIGKHEEATVHVVSLHVSYMLLAQILDFVLVVVTNLTLDKRIFEISAHENYLLEIA